VVWSRGPEELTLNPLVGSSRVRPDSRSSWERRGRASPSPQPTHGWALRQIQCGGEACFHRGGCRGCLLLRACLVHGTSLRVVARLSHASRPTRCDALKICLGLTGPAGCSLDRRLFSAATNALLVGPFLLAAVPSCWLRSRGRPSSRRWCCPPSSDMGFCSAKAPPELRASGCPRVVKRMCCWLRLLLLLCCSSADCRPCPAGLCAGRPSSACCALRLLHSGRSRWSASARGVWLSGRTGSLT